MSQPQQPDFHKIAFLADTIAARLKDVMPQPGSVKATPTQGEVWRQDYDGDGQSIRRREVTTTIQLLAEIADSLRVAVDLLDEVADSLERQRKQKKRQR